MSKAVKRPAQLLAALVLVLGTLVLTGGVAFADGSVDWTGNGTTNGSLNSVKCDAENTPYLHWIFGLGNGNTVTSVTLNLDDGNSSGSFTVNSSDTDVSDGNGFSGGVVHITTPFFDLDTLVASIDYVGTLGSGQHNLNISHGCPGNEAAIASISTEIHAGANDDEGTTIIPVGTSIDLGSTVHDSATLTTDPTGIDMPDGSKIVYYFFDDQEACDALDTASAIATSSPNFDVSAETSEFTQDPGLFAGPLGAGDYGFIAQFLSGDTDIVTNATSDCEPFTVDKGDTETVTTLVEEAGGTELPASPPADIPHLPLGSSVHDTAVVNGGVDGFPITGTVTYHFYVGTTACDTVKEQGTGEPVTIDGVTGEVPDSSSTGVLGAGDYSFNAEYSGDGDGGNYNASGLSACEPFVIDQGVTTTVTKVLDANGSDVTGATVPNGSVVHDSAEVGPAVNGFPLTGTVTYYFSSTGCAGTFTLFDTVTIDQNGDVPNSKDTDPLTSGSYAFYAVYSGDQNYAGSTGDCEPFSVRTFGKTMGFWGNTNGQALLASNSAFTTANAVTLGINSTSPLRCFVTVDSASKSTTIFPNTLNGQSTIPQCDTTGERDSVNTGSFNNLLSQTLAISYNIKYITGYAGQTIAGMGCAAVAPLTSSFDGQNGLTGTSTVQQVRDYANRLIGQTIKNNGSLVVTQAQIGAMNTLLGCLNAEA